jgi:hypothetical protein
VSNVPVTTKSSKLPDLWEERPPGSKSWEIRKDVKVLHNGLDGTVYYVPDKKVYYIQRDPPGSSTLHYYGPISEQSSAELLPTIKHIIAQQADDTALGRSGRRRTSASARDETAVEGGRAGHSAA